MFEIDMIRNKRTEIQNIKHYTLLLADGIILLAVSNHGK